MIIFIAIATAVTLVLWWILDLVRTDEKAIRIKFGRLGRKGRKLDLYEEFLWTAQNKVGLGVNVNAVLIESSEDVTETHVRQALNALWRRHPLLRCSIITISRGRATMNYFTEIAGKPNYDLQMVPSIDWKEIFEENLNNRFMSSGPQWRVQVTLPRRENGRYVFPFIFSFNCCIVDGASITEGVFKDFQRFLTKAVYPESMSDSVGDASGISATVGSDVMGASFSDMSSSILSTSVDSFMSSSTSDAMDTSGDTDTSVNSADDTSTAVLDVKKKMSYEVKVLRLLPAPEYLYKELKPRLYELPLLAVVNQFYHRPFLSPDPTSIRIQTHLKPRASVRKTGVFTFLLNEKETANLLQECCAKSVSVTSVILAAAAVSLQDILRSKAFHGNIPLKLNALFMCDMRQVSNLDVPKNTLGNHEGMLDVIISLPKPRDMVQNIWTPAQSLHTTLENKLQSSQVFSWSRWLNYMLGRKNGVNAFLARVSKTPSKKSYAFLIRDRGKLERPEDQDADEEKHCQVKEMYFMSAEHMVSLAMFSICIATLQGQIDVTIGYDNHVVDDVIAEEFTELLKESLTRRTEPERKISDQTTKTGKFGFQALRFWYSTSR